MNQVTFQNDGIIDPVAIATFGVNAKDSDNPIGYFGTGLKYALAVLLRDQCNVKIQAGDNHYSFSKKESIIRDKSFDVVYMNDQPLGFTTELGKDWEMWQAFRELYCNALDEDGFVTDGQIACTDNKTTIIVGGSSFHNCYLNRAEIVIQSDPLASNAYADIHPGTSNFVYYKGVRIYDGFYTTAFTYNIHSDIDISEDRTAKYNWELNRKIATAVTQLTDPELIVSILLADRGTFEGQELDYGDTSGSPSDVFLDIAEQYRLDVRTNSTLLRLLSKHKRLPEPKHIPLTDVQKKMLKRAVKFSKNIGYAVDAYPIITSDELKGGLQGMARANTIYLSPDTFGFGTKYLAATLIEEYLHLNTGYGDMTRELQNRLFNDIVSLGEQLIGEPV